MISGASSPTKSDLSRSIDIPKSLKNVFAKKICGDIFGTSQVSLEGLFYKVRTQTAAMDPNRNNHIAENVEESKNVSEEKISHEVVESSCSEDEVTEKMNPRQQLALTIRNWTCQSENDCHLLQEGGIQALIALASFDDSRIRRCVATAMYNLSSRQANRQEIIMSGGAAGVVTIGINARTK